MMHIYLNIFNRFEYKYLDILYKYFVKGNQWFDWFKLQQ